MPRRVRASDVITRLYGRGRGAAAGPPPAPGARAESPGSGVGLCAGAATRAGSLTGAGAGAGAGALVQPAAAPMTRSVNVFLMMRGCGGRVLAQAEQLMRLQ